MVFEKTAYDKTRMNQALDVSIHIGLAFLLAALCLLILRPFVLLIAWGIIIAVASYPAFLQMQSALGGRGGLAAVLYTLILLAILIVPAVLAGAEPGGRRAYDHRALERWDLGRSGTA